LMHKWNWLKSLGRIVHHSSKHQPVQTNLTEKFKSSTNQEEGKKLVNSNSRKQKSRTQPLHISTSRGHREVKASLPMAKSQIT
jgi:hypothetical protein